MIRDNSNLVRPGSVTTRSGTANDYDSSTQLPMDVQSEPNTMYHVRCLCERTFTHPAAYKNHQNTCKVNKICLSNALEGVQKVLVARKLEKKERILNKLNPGRQGYLTETAATIVTTTVSQENEMVSLSFLRCRFCPGHSHS